MLPSPAEIDCARRVLKAIEHGGHPSQADALLLRLWAGPRTPLQPLEEIAKQVMMWENRSKDPPQRTP